MKTIICDIDHTLADAAWRDHLLGPPWEAYHEASKDDKPILAIAEAVKALNESGFHVVALTTRPEKYRRITMDWLIRHGIPVDEIMMRPDTDYRTSPVLKAEQILERFPDLSQIAFCLDDRDDVCSAFQELGLLVLHVKAGFTK